MKFLQKLNFWKRLKAFGQKGLALSLPKGFSLIELMITIGLFGVILPGLLLGFAATRNGRAQAEKRQQAIALMEEGQEGTRVYAEDWKDFINTNVGVNYYLSKTGNTWSLSLASSSTDTITPAGFTRTIKVYDVLRETSSGNIVATCTTVCYTDPSTKKVTVTVTWSAPIASSISSSEYVTRNTNLSHTETTDTEFNSGTVPSTIAVTGTGPSGAITLGPGATLSDWCGPSLSITPMNFSGGNPVPQYITSTYQNAYVTTGGNSSSFSIDHIALTDPAPPTNPSAQESGSYKNFKSYGIFANSKYAFLVTDHPGLTVDIVNISSSPYTQAATYANSVGNSLTGGTNNNIYVLNNIGYVTVGNYLFLFDLTPNGSGNITGARTELGKFQLDGTGGRVMVTTNTSTGKLTAYVAVMGSTKTGIEMFDVSGISIANKKDPSLLGKVVFSANQTFSDLIINSSGTRIYYTSSDKLLYVINSSNPASTSILNSSHLYSTNTMSPKNITLIEADKRVIIVGSADTAHEQYQVIKIDDETFPSHCGGLTAPGGATNISAISSLTEPDGEVYSYIITNQSSGGTFQIIQGGPGGTNGLYAASGVFTSQTQPLALTNLTAFNSFTADVRQSPPNTSVKLQVAVAKLVSGSCPTSAASYTYVGPNGDTSAYFTSNNNQIIGTIPLGSFGTNYQNPGQCLRYQATLGTADTNTLTPPILYDIIFNYSP